MTEVNSLKIIKRAAFMRGFMVGFFITLIFLFIGIIWIVTSPSSDEQQPKPYLSSTYMVLPDNVQDWKVTTDRNQNIYYCEVDNKWYFCYPNFKSDSK